MEFQTVFELKSEEYNNRIISFKQHRNMQIYIMIQYVSFSYLDGPTLGCQDPCLICFRKARAEQRRDDAKGVGPEHAHVESWGFC